jgi:hypothetical protein
LLHQPWFVIPEGDLLLPLPLLSSLLLSSPLSLRLRLPYSIADVLRGMIESSHSLIH